MAVTKTARTIQTSATNTAGSATTSSALDLRTTLGGIITAKITNGGTGPTIGCTCYVEVSNDNSAWKAYTSARAGTTNNLVTEFVFRVDESIMYVRTRFADNTGQSVTVEAFMHELSSL